MDDEVVSIEKQFAQTIKDIKVLSNDDHIKLFKQLDLERKHNNNKNAKLIIDKLVKHNLKLVVSIASKYNFNDDDYMDIIQEGNIGLMIAIDNYEVKKGFAFSSYAFNHIRGKILRYITKNYKIVKLNPDINKEIKLMNSIEDKLTARAGHKPSLKEVADKMNSTIENVATLKTLEQPAASLNHPVSNEDDDEELEEVDLLESDYNEEKVMNDYDYNKLTDDILNFLNDDEAAVIRLKFDLFDKDNTKEMMENKNIPDEKMRQIEARAMYKIRKRFKKDNIFSAN